jgi:hypothetical protein
MLGRLDSRELGEEFREHFLGNVSVLRGQLKIGGLKLFLAVVKSQGRFFTAP